MMTIGLLAVLLGVIAVQWADGRFPFASTRRRRAIVYPSSALDRMWSRRRNWPPDCLPLWPA